MQIFFSSLERVVISVLALVLGLMLFDMLIAIAPIRKRIAFEESRAFSSRLANALFLFLLIWKLFPLVTGFQQILDQPVLAIYMPGGMYGAAVGFLVFILYMMPLLPSSKSMWKDIRQQSPRSLIYSLLLMIVVLLLSHSTAVIAFQMWNASRLNVNFG